MFHPVAFMTALGISSTLLLGTVEAAYSSSGSSMQSFPSAPQAPSQKGPAPYPSQKIQLPPGPTPQKMRMHPKHSNPPPPPPSIPFTSPYLDQSPVMATHEDAQEILELIENQLSAIQAHDFNRAYFMYTSPYFRDHTPFDEFKFFVESYSVLTQNKNALFGNPEFIRDHAIIKGTLSALNGQVFKADYYLIKEDNQWKIKGIKLFPAAPRPISVPAGADYDFQSDIQRY